MLIKTTPTIFWESSKYGRGNFVSTAQIVSQTNDSACTCAGSTEDSGFLEVVNMDIGIEGDTVYG